MREAILQFSETIQQGFALAQPLPSLSKYRRIICCGMGGSSIPGLLLATVHPNTTVVHSDRDLPDAQPDDLVICISWSGETAETISSLKKAIKSKIDIVVITKGGALARIAKEHNVPLVILPDVKIPARLGCGYMIGALWALVGPHTPPPTLSDAITHEDKGKEIAKAIGQKVPVFYASSQLWTIGVLWKMLFNENAKIPAFSNWFPRAGHNEIEGYYSSIHRTAFLPVVFDDGSIGMEQVLAFFKKIEYNCLIVSVSQGALVQQFLEIYILGLWASYYLAQLLSVDPSDTEFIESFKILQQK